MKAHWFLGMVLFSACSSTAPSGDVVEGTARAPDGVPIAYEARGTGEPALVFVHGWGCDRGYWRDQVDVFDGEHRVVTLDLGGHGQSGTERKNWTVPGLAGDVQAVVDHLHLDRFVLIGHSMGGPVSLAAAARMPGRVVAVVGVDTLHDANFRMPKETVEQIATSFETDFAGTIAGFVPSMISAGADPALKTWIIERASATPRAPAIALMKAFADVDPKALLAGAKVPVRCINAAPYGDRPMATAIDTNRKYADFDAVIMQDVGHYPMLEKPQEFNGKLRHVLATLDEDVPRQ